MTQMCGYIQKQLEIEETLKRLERSRYELELTIERIEKAQKVPRELLDFEIDI